MPAFKYSLLTYNSDYQHVVHRPVGPVEFLQGAEDVTASFAPPASA